MASPRLLPVGDTVDYGHVLLEGRVHQFVVMFQEISMSKELGSLGIATVRHETAQDYGKMK